MPGVWSPTAALALERAILVGTSGRREAIAVAGQSTLHVENRARTSHLLNWYRPIGRWYEEDPSAREYPAPLPEHVDAVVQVGLRAYPLGSGHLFL